MADTTGLMATVKNGKMDETSTKLSSTKKPGGEMGKDEFLQLLVAQMKYQDPLEPTDNTQYVSQLASFSSLEQMQNLNQTTVNSQAFSLVGKEVIMETTSSSGSTSYLRGKVDYVTMNGNKAYFSINNKLYPSDDLYTVVGDEYVISQKVPTVTEANLTYDHTKPTDQSVNISLGKDEYEASMVAVVINGKAIPAEQLSYSDGKVTISKDALKDLDAGTYKVAFVFNDVLNTTYTNKVTIKVTGSKPDNGDSDNGGSDNGDSSNQGNTGTA